MKFHLSAVLVALNKQSYDTVTSDKMQYLTIEFDALKSLLKKYVLTI